MDAFPLNETAETTTHNSESQTTSAVGPAAPSNGRFYKSRKARPCDACRRRKVTCHMPANPPCQRCRAKDQACTFAQGPGKKKRPVRDQLPPQSTLLPESTLRAAAFEYERLDSWPSHEYPSLPSLHTGYTPTAFPHARAYSIDAVWATADVIVAGTVPVVAETDRLGAPDSGVGAFGYDTAAVSNPGRPTSSDYASRASASPAGSLSDRSTPHSHSHNPTWPELASPSQLGSSTRSAPSSVVPAQEDFTTHGSLEVLSGAFSFYIGPTGVSDALLLQREAYGDGGVAPASVRGLQYRRVAHLNDDSPVLFGITDHALIEKAEPKSEPAAMEEAWAALWQMIDAPTAWGLVKLYTRFVDPYFPIVSSHQLPSSGADGLTAGSLSLALLTALCAAALPFVVHDRSLYPLLLRPPSSDQLYRLCWLGITQELHAPNLGTLQACLLLQQRLPTNLYLHDTAFAWSLIATAVSVAQTLGLHREPSRWTGIPAWERRLRRRLWWTLWSTEKWVALARGMPSHLAPAGADDEYADVDPLSRADTSPGDTLSWNTNSSAARQPHLLYLVHLTTILADIQRSYYTLRAARQTSRHLALAMDIGRPLRAKLQSWRDSLPAGLCFRSRDQSSPEADQTRSTIHTILDNSDGVAAEVAQPSDDLQRQKLDGNASLHLSYIVTHMMLFRALLRPLDGSDSGNSSDGDRNTGIRNRAVTKGALLCVREFVEFVEALSPTQWNAFWHGWSRANFAMAGSFMVYLLRIITVPPLGSGEQSPKVARPGFADEYQELLSWIGRWRWASRVSVHGAAGAKGLTNLMLLRVETFLGELGDLDELGAR
ncbi:fungal specific transcription factor domain protein [Ophiostoma piceae UAMH 11346]|uniref:Fungal specific transcription factor domain protein n=1 Tax=Ophiostoma piceae (strain UAMH 11346) TaxID=1262450 RepID=S3CEM5_OPHP1|nr:fungal specific transcription factor domain protein [Ophiostoma piceae UAMH 11346]